MHPEASKIVGKGWNGGPHAKPFIEKLRKEMLWLQQTEMFVEYHTSKQLTKQTSNRNQELLTVQKSETAWK